LTVAEILAGRNDITFPDIALIMPNASAGSLAFCA
jgi:hypothetical protein